MELAANLDDCRQAFEAGLGEIGECTEARLEPAGPEHELRFRVVRPDKTEIVGWVIPIGMDLTAAATDMARVYREARADP